MSPPLRGLHATRCTRHRTTGICSHHGQVRTSTEHAATRAAADKVGTTQVFRSSLLQTSQPSEQTEGRYSMVIKSDLKNICTLLLTTPPAHASS